MQHSKCNYGLYFLNFIKKRNSNRPRNAVSPDFYKIKKWNKKFGDLIFIIDVPNSSNLSVRQPTGWAQTHGTQQERWQSCWAWGYFLTDYMNLVEPGHFLVIWHNDMSPIAGLIGYKAEPRVTGNCLEPPLPHRLPLPWRIFLVGDNRIKQMCMHSEEY